MNRESLKAMLNDRDHLSRCKALKRVTAGEFSDRECEPLVADALRDPYPVVVENALSALERFYPLSGRSLEAVLRTFSLYIREQGCSYSCCGWEALRHPEIIRKSGGLLLKTLSHVGADTFFERVRQFRDNRLLAPDDVNEILAFLVASGNREDVEKAPRFGLAEPEGNAFFLS